MGMDAPAFIKSKGRLQSNTSCRSAFPLLLLPPSGALHVLIYHHHCSINTDNAVGYPGTLENVFKLKIPLQIYEGFNVPMHPGSENVLMPFTLLQFWRISKVSILLVLQVTYPPSASLLCESIRKRWLRSSLFHFLFCATPTITDTPRLAFQIHFMFLAMLAAPHLTVGWLLFWTSVA